MTTLYDHHCIIGYVIWVNVGDFPSIPNDTDAYYAIISPIVEKY